MRFGITNPFVKDEDQRRNNDDLLNGLNQVAQFTFSGEGVPTFDPGGPAEYWRSDGGAGSTLYVYEPGSGWAAK